MKRIGLVLLAVVTVAGLVGCATCETVLDKSGDYREYNRCVDARSADAARWQAVNAAYWSAIAAGQKQQQQELERASQQADLNRQQQELLDQQLEWQKKQEHDRKQWEWRHQNGLLQ